MDTVGCEGGSEVRQEISAANIEALVSLAEALSGQPVKSIHVNRQRVCDNCHDEDDEAFPYHVNSADGRFWKDLCNGCFDKLECSYSEE